MLSRVVFSTLALAALAAAHARAGTMTVYAVAPGALNTGPQNMVEVPPVPNSDHFFDVFIKTDVEIQGMSLDVFLIGTNTLTSVIVQNPLNGPSARWDTVFNGTVSADGKSATAADAFTLSSSNRGMNPLNAGTDQGYSPLAGAFHYARVNYRGGPYPLGPNNMLRLGIGQGDIGANPPTPTTLVFLGVSPPGTTEPAACSTQAFDCPGATSQFFDGEWSIPEPASVTLLGLAVMGLVGRVRRRR